MVWTTSCVPSSRANSSPANGCSGPGGHEPRHGRALGRDRSGWAASRSSAWVSVRSTWHTRSDIRGFSADDGTQWSLGRSVCVTGSFIASGLDRKRDDSPSRAKTVGERLLCRDGATCHRLGPGSPSRIAIRVHDHPERDKSVTSCGSSVPDGSGDRRVFRRELRSSD